MSTLKTRLYVAQEAVRFGVTPEAIMSRQRSARIVDARESVMLRLRADGHSFPMIGRLMGRHHSSVISLIGQYGNHKREQMRAYMKARAGQEWAA